MLQELVGLDCAAMFARTGMAAELCAQFGFPKQKSYHYSKYGGEGPSSKLVTGFARQGQCVLPLGVSRV